MSKSKAMRYTRPHTIDNGHGERLTFVRLEGDKLFVENLVQPGAGPPMHVHYKQAESLTVVSGRIGVQEPGKPPAEYGPGSTVTFQAGVAHKFWAAGDEPLRCTGWIQPAHNIEYFLTEIYASTKASGKGRPDDFEGAYLGLRYKSEFDILEVPAFVRKVIFPITVFFGKLAGKHKKYADAPEPVR